MSKPKPIKFDDLMDWTNLPGGGPDMIRDDGKCFSMDEATGKIVEVQLPEGDSIWNHIVPFGGAKK